MPDETSGPERIHRVQPEQIRPSEPTRQNGYHTCSREEVRETQAILQFCNLNIFFGCGHRVDCQTALVFLFLLFLLLTREVGG